LLPPLLKGHDRIWWSWPNSYVPVAVKPQWAEIHRRPGATCQLWWLAGAWAGPSHLDDIGGIESRARQSPGLLPYWDMLSFGRKHGGTTMKHREFIALLGGVERIGVRLTTHAARNAKPLTRTSRSDRPRHQPCDPEWGCAPSWSLCSGRTEAHGPPGVTWVSVAVSLTSPRHSSAEAVPCVPRASSRSAPSTSIPPAVARRPQRQPARGRVQLAASTRLEWQSGPWV